MSRVFISIFAALVLLVGCSDEEDILREVVVVVPRLLAGTDFDAGFALRREGYTNWFNGKPLRTEVAR